MICIVLLVVRKLVCRFVCFNKSSSGTETNQRSWDMGVG